MTPYQCFRGWMAIKTHLTDIDYDIVKYQGKMKSADVDAYENCPQKFQFERLSKHYSPQWLMLSVLLDKETAWVGETKGDRAEELCAERMGKAEALTHTFKTDLGNLPKDIISSIKYEKGRHPLMMRTYLGKRISLETFTVMGAITGFPETWLKEGRHDLMVESVARKALKYRTFLGIDKTKFRKIVVDHLKISD